MHSDQYFHSKEAMPPLTNQVDNNNMHFPVATTFAAVQPLAAKHLMPVHGIEFQSSEICPRNFIIFDQADHRSQVMYNPAVAHNHGGPGFNIHATYIQENFERTDTYNVEREISSSLKEDSDDIDALMSLEEEEPEECDGEEVSTARTCGNYGSSSPDSCSSYGAKPMKKGSSVQKCSSSGSSSNSERKRQKMKTMVKTLRGIVPGGDQMNTVTVLDEAVRYLKSLKVEVQKLGVGNFKN
ncbi:transcription factor bHLH144 [Populus alba]|uniref:Transcription factor bHLH144-like n=1 Tax=Populus alba TaxID=43335 RepID=A0A4U5QIR2_POPAL|nr:transcription factor bHLH144 [Populus alba]XP_034922369.1 transcription factor bHLH144 [Populus alba]XP_034922370.1 transcription factor bHLH144 [Populus alba]XP_034922371.1 transcription factor bHLH144 [Populus alba]XP_034922372.1 transcription factor bHLH144 [Populus alba]XP_034922373.1 transcription factor bHLH144 [Populus alba]XP_034922374.1 transcription factor bHLH144 [Populus alba]XP_034922375.1 transcription factor bHLH144 [Populus alba]XP_034922377.1 transcription factor bHLH144